MRDIICDLCEQPIDISSATPEQQARERAMLAKRQQDSLVCCKVCAERNADILAKIGAAFQRKANG